MTTVAIAPTPILQFLDNRGAPAIGGSLLTQVGGVNYPTYQDAAGTIALPNPIPLNNRGEISNAAGVSCQLFLDTSAVYTFTLSDSAGNVLNQAANVSAPASAASLTSFIASLAASTGAALVGWIQAATGAVARFVSTKLGEEMSIEDFGASIANTAAQNDAAIAAGLAWAGTPTKTIIAGKVVLGLRALKIPARGYSFKFQTKISVPNGVRFYGHSLGASVLEWMGTGVAIQMGDSSAEYFGIACDNFTILNGGSDVTTSEGVVAINCIRACTISNVMANGFWKSFHPQGEAFGLFMDHLYSQGALLRALHWEGSTACGLHVCRFDTNGEHGIVIDGQSSGGLTPPNNYSPWGVSLTSIVVQGCQKSAVYGIDVQSLYIGGASFFESNNLVNGTWADVYIVQGTAAIKSLVIDVMATFGVGSRTGTTNRALTVNSARLVRFNGSSVVGAGIFDKGVLLGSDVDRAEVKSYINIGAGNEVDAQPGTVLDYQDSSGNNLLGERTTPLAFSHIQKTKAAGITHFVYNPSSTSGSVAQQFQVGTTLSAGFLLYGLNAGGTNVFRVADNGDCKNTNNVFAAISDEKLKQDVAPAASSWNDFKSYEFVKYRLKTDPTGPLHLGVIAQQIELISPGLVSESEDFEHVEEGGEIVHRPTGTTTKEVKYSILYAKACVVLQEAMRRIEALEARP